MSYLKRKKTLVENGFPLEITRNLVENETSWAY